MKIYKVYIHEIADEQLFGSDWECDHFNEWDILTVRNFKANSIQEALEKAVDYCKDSPWSSVSHDEKIHATKNHFKSHSIENTEYTEALQRKYGGM